MNHLSTPRPRCRLSALLLVLLVCLPFASGAAQQADTGFVHLTGYVVDRQSGQPLPGATVEIAAVLLRAVADDAGRFDIRRVPRGRHQATVRRIGYAPYTAVWDVRDDPHVLTVALGSRPLVLQGVTVQGYSAAQQIEQRRRSTGVSSVTYSRRDLERSASGDAWSFLRSRVSLGQRQRSQRGYQAHRTAAPQQIGLAYFVDEMPASREGLEDLDLEQIYSIEVYGGRHVRVYTLSFIELQGKSNVPLFPLSVR